ncbi:Arabinose 5-phosphate isomerase KpsF [Symmachiella macrocystis]|uniref:Arabinose 5-phosphate isomerase KpsF n=1 Tax=Symmachiella macrocystis TaxID=2527985 RepID=A0A5C6BQT8_9PLAN|nr:KpsF/GutQ family sugar-phosphate isomerase [Symmachiella macrocystis]TWU14385.1 Arabinose 5-phosphate isomerase KpsF [Symmachiella macrocystis]
MSALQPALVIPTVEVARLRAGKQIIREEATALNCVAENLSVQFSHAVETILACTGRVVVTGMGKAGWIGQKIAATLSSTGTPAQFLHPAEAVHGDLGCLHGGDVVLALSNSGETDEICQLIHHLKSMPTHLIAITGRETSTLAAASDITLSLGPVGEAGQLKLAPTNSTTAMLAVGDALAIVLSEERGFTPQDFARFHPGGSLGNRLKTVAETMRHGTDLRISNETRSIRDVLVGLSRPERRTGAVMLVDADGGLTGIFTDSDLARLLEQRADEQLDQPISNVMTRRPVTITADAMLTDALAILSQRRISELPVVDPEGCPVGLIDITDVIGLLPDVAARPA